MELISRKQALQAGRTAYFTGKPCKHGHVSERFVTDRSCYACRAEQALARYHANPEPARAREKAWRTANADKKREYARKWTRSNKDKCAQYNTNFVSKKPHDYTTKRVRAWRKENPEKAKFHSTFYGNIRRAALLQRTPAWADFAAIATVYEDAAEFRAAGIEVDVDHIVPLQGDLVSGLHVAENLRVCLSSVNRAKSNAFST